MLLLIMKGLELNKLAIAFAIGACIALSCNGWILVYVLQLHTKTLAEQQNRQQSLQISSDIQQETAALSRMVRAYTTSAENKYLTYYYDIIDIRQGKKAQPDDYGPAYWAEVMAGQRAHAMPENRLGTSLLERMQAQGFSQEEFAAMDKIVACSQTLFEQDQIAFAATQGLYDPVGKRFTDEGQPERGFANNFVYSDSYLRLENDLLQEVKAFSRLTDERTTRAVQWVSSRLTTSIYAAIAIMSITLILVLTAMGVIFRKVLAPMRSLMEKTLSLGVGDYSIRADTGQGVLEIQALGKTFNAMADNIQEDILRREKIYRELEIASAKAEESTRAKSMFLANMSHEIRTPMNAIVGMTYLALNTELSERQQDYIGKIQNAAQSLLRVINDILDFTKIEAGKLELEKVAFRLEDLVGNVLSLLRQPAIEKGIELLLNISDERLTGNTGTFLGDPLRLKQVLTNLLSNAIKFTDKGHVQLSIIEKSRTGNSCNLQFNVLDTGVGMTLEQVGRLFQEFSQADGSTTRRHGGTGLGLAIVKRLLDLMGGEISVTSEANRGTCFTCNITLQIPDRKVVPKSHSAIIGRGNLQPESPLPKEGWQEAPLSAARSATGYPRFQGMRILLVEDNLLNQEIALELLAYHGALVDLAANGKEALDMIGANPDDYYHAVLMDIQMPVMDGYEATRLLREQPRYAALPIIAMTAHAMVEEQNRCAVLGMNAHVAKPFRLENLLQTLAPYFHTPTEHLLAVQPAASASAAAPVFGGSLAEIIPGIDLEKGLSLCDGKMELYRNILEGYAREYSELVNTLRLHLANGQYMELTNLAHSFKGLSGTIGAQGLHELGERIERGGALHSPALHLLLGELEELLPLTLGGLHRYFSLRQDESVAVFADVSDVADHSQVLLEHLRCLLGESDSAALDFWTMHGHTFKKILPPAVAKKIAMTITAFQFEEALALLNSSQGK
jgi:two-component system, sensor histidine kinase and response regulator